MLPIGHAWIDSSLAPIYQVRFPESTSDELLHAYCRAIEAWSCSALHPVAWVLDLSRVVSVSARQRAIFADFLLRMEPFDARFTRASALIVSNPMIRGVVTAVFWLKPPPFPHQTFAAAPEALAWARQMMRASQQERLSL